MEGTVGGSGNTTGQPASWIHTVQSRTGGQPEDGTKLLRPERAYRYDGGTPGTWWDTNITYVYKGQLYFPGNANGNRVRFEWHIDDNGYLLVDGKPWAGRTNPDWNGNDTGVLTPGWHTYEFRPGQGGGGAGPTGAFGWDPTGVGGTVALQDPGNMSVFRTITTGTFARPLGPIVMENSAELDLMGNDASTPSITATAANQIHLSAATLTVNFSGADQVFPGTMDGGSLVKNGLGKWTLTGANNVSIGTTINADSGSIHIGEDAGSTTAWLGSGPVSIGANSTLVLNRTDTPITMPTVSGAGNFTQTFSSQQDLTLPIGAAGLTGAISFAGGSASQQNSVTMPGTGGGAVINLGTMTVPAYTTLNFNTNNNFTIPNYPNFTGDTATNPIGLTNAATLSLTVATDKTHAGAITGNGNLYKTGAAKLTLTGANTYTGATTVNNGTLETNHLGTVGSLTLGGASTPGTLRYVGPAVTSGGGVNVLAGGGTLIHAGSGPIVYNGSGGGTGSFTVSGAASDGTQDVAINGNLALGGGTLTKQGLSTLTLKGVNVMGATQISEGNVVADNGSLGSGPVTVAGGAKLTVGFDTTTSAGLRAQFFGRPGGDTSALIDMGSLSTLAGFNTWCADNSAKIVWDVPTTTGPRPRLYYPDQGMPDGYAHFYSLGFNNANLPAIDVNNNYSARMEGQIKITSAGTYNFIANSDDGSMIWVDGQQVVSNANWQGMADQNWPDAAQGNRTAINLSAGLHSIVVGFNEGGGGHGLNLSYQGPDTASDNGAPYNKRNGWVYIPNTALQYVAKSNTIRALEITGLTGDGTVDLQGGTLTINSTTANSSFSGALHDDDSGSGGVGNLVKKGPFKFTVTAPQLHSGATTVNQGTLEIPDLGGMVSSPVTVKSGAVLRAGDVPLYTLVMESGARLTRIGASPTTLGTTPLSMASGVIRLNGGSINDFRFHENSPGIVINDTIEALNGGAASGIDLGDAGPTNLIGINVFAADGIAQFQPSVLNKTYDLIHYDSYDGSYLSAAQLGYFAVLNAIGGLRYQFVNHNQVITDLGGGSTYEDQWLALQINSGPRWVGQTADPNWSKADAANQNWTIAQPAGDASPLWDSDVIAFGGVGANAANVATVNDLATTLDSNKVPIGYVKLKAMIFTPGSGADGSGPDLSYSIDQNGITLTGDVDNNIIRNDTSVVQTINVPITLGANNNAIYANGGDVTLGGGVHTAGKTLVVNTNSGKTVAINGPIADGGGVTKNGLGKLILGGAGPHAYTGVTTVNAGTLQVDATLNPTGSTNGVTMMNNTTLSGTGWINRPLNIGDGLAAASVAMQSTGTLRVGGDALSVVTIKSGAGLTINSGTLSGAAGASPAGANVTIAAGANPGLVLNGGKLEASTITVNGKLSAPNGGLDVYQRYTTAAGLDITQADTTKSFEVAGTETNLAKLTLKGGTVNMSGGGNVVTNGLVVYWPLDGNTNDASGNNKNGTLGGGGALTANGKLGGGLTLNGSTPALSAGMNATGISGSASRSISAWFKASNDGGDWQDIFGFIGNEGASGTFFDFERGNGHNYCLHTYGGDYNGIGWEGSNWPWHLLTATYDNANNNILVYVDGVLRSTNNRDALGTIDNFGVAVSRAGVTGTIDDVRLYNRALSQQDINDLYNYTGGMGGTAVDVLQDTTFNANQGAAVPIPQFGDLGLSANLALGQATKFANLNGKANATISGNPILLGGNVNVDAGKTVTIADTADLQGANTMSMAGPGTLKLEGPKTFTGTIALNAGTLDLAHASALANAKLSGGPGVVAPSVPVSTVAGLTGTAKVNIQGPNALAVNISTGVQTSNASLGGNGGFQKVGGGELQVLGTGGNNSGTMSVVEGRLMLGPRSTGNVSAMDVAQGATLVLQQSPRGLSATGYQRTTDNDLNQWNTWNGGQGVGNVMDTWNHDQDIAANWNGNNTPGAIQYGDKDQGTTQNWVYQYTPTSNNGVWQRNYAADYSVQWQGMIYLNAGTYKFQTQSDDASAIWIGAAVANPKIGGRDGVHDQVNDNTIINNNGGHGEDIRNSDGYNNLSFTADTAGYYPFLVRMDQGWGGHGVLVNWNQGDGSSNYVPIPISQFVREVGSLGISQLTGAGNVEVNGSTLTINTPDGVSAQFNGSIIDGANAGGSLIKTGLGTQILNATASTFTGPTTVNGGVLQLNAGATLASPYVLLNTGGTLVPADANVLASTALRGGGGTVAPSVPVANVGSLTDTGLINIQGPNAIGLTVATGNTSAYQGTIGSDGGLKKLGGGELQFTGAGQGPHTGLIDVAEGRFLLGPSATAGTSQVNVGTGATFALTTPVSNLRAQFSSNANWQQDFFGWQNPTRRNDGSAFNAWFDGMPKLYTTHTGWKTALQYPGGRLDDANPDTWNQCFGPMGWKPGTANYTQDNFVTRWDGYIKITQGGDYQFMTQSDDNSALWIDGTEVCMNNEWQGMDPNWGPDADQAGTWGGNRGRWTINLAPGYHKIVVAMNEGGGGYGLNASYAGPDTAGIPNSNGWAFIPNSVLYQSLGGATIASLTGTGNVELNGSTLTVNTPAGTTPEFTGTMVDGTGGAGSLAKSGPGSLTLSSALAYTGPTTVNGGALNVKAALASPTVTLAGGTVNVYGADHLAGATIVAAGGSIAPQVGGMNLINVAGLSAPAGSPVTLTLAPGMVNVTGGLNLPANAALTIAGPADALLGVGGGGTLAAGSHLDIVGGGVGLSGVQGPGVINVNAGGVLGPYPGMTQLGAQVNLNQAGKIDTLDGSYGPVVLSTLNLTGQGKVLMAGSPGAGLHGAITVTNLTFTVGATPLLIVPETIGTGSYEFLTNSLGQNLPNLPNTPFWSASTSTPSDPLIKWGNGTANWDDGTPTGAPGSTYHWLGDSTLGAYIDGYGTPSLTLHVYAPYGPTNGPVGTSDVEIGSAVVGSDITVKGPANNTIINSLSIGGHANNPTLSLAGNPLSGNLIIAGETAIAIDGRLLTGTDGTAGFQTGSLTLAGSMTIGAGVLAGVVGNANVTGTLQVDGNFSVGGTITNAGTVNYAAGSAAQYGVAAINSTGSLNLRGSQGVGTVNVTGGSLAMSSGSIGTLTVSGGTSADISGGQITTATFSGGGNNTISNGNVTTLNLSGGTSNTVSGGAVGTANISGGNNNAISAPAVTTANVSGGNTAISGAGTTTLNLSGGQVSLSGGVGAMTYNNATPVVTLTGPSTAASVKASPAIVGQPTLNVGGNALTISTALVTGDYTFTTSGPAFKVQSGKQDNSNVNVLDNGATRLLTLNGGTLTIQANTVSNPGLLTKGYQHTTNNQLDQWNNGGLGNLMDTWVTDKDIDGGIGPGAVQYANKDELTSQDWTTQYSPVSNGGVWQRPYHQDYSVEWSGLVHLNAGTYKFQTRSDDATGLWIGDGVANPRIRDVRDQPHDGIVDNSIINNNQGHGVDTRNSDGGGNLSFNAPTDGYYAFLLRGNQGWGGHGFFLEWNRGDGSSTYVPVPVSAFTHKSAGAVNLANTHVAVATGTASTLDLGNAAVDHVLGDLRMTDGASLTIQNGTSVSFNNITNLTGSGNATVGAGQAIPIHARGSVAPAGVLTFAEDVVLDAGASASFNLTAKPDEVYEQVSLNSNYLTLSSGVGALNVRFDGGPTVIGAGTYDLFTGLYPGSLGLPVPDDGTLPANVFSNTTYPTPETNAPDGYKWVDLYPSVDGVQWIKYWYDATAGCEKISVELALANVVVGVDTHWTGGGANTTWSTVANWANNGVPRVPSAAGDTARFDTGLGSPNGGSASVDADGQTVAQIFFRSAQSYSIAGGALTMDSAGQGNAKITISEGDHSIGSDLLLASNLTILPAAGTSLTLADVGETPAGSGKSVTVNDGGKVVLNGTGSFTGGLFVPKGEVELVKSTALAAGTPITIGAQGQVVLGIDMVAGAASAKHVASVAAVNAVPEPGTLVLLAVAALVAIGAGLRRNRP